MKMGGRRKRKNHRPLSCRPPEVRSPGCPVFPFFRHGGHNDVIGEAEGTGGLPSGRPGPGTPRGVSRRALQWTLEERARKIRQPGPGRGGVAEGGGAPREACSCCVVESCWRHCNRVPRVPPLPGLGRPTPAYAGPGRTPKVLPRGSIRVAARGGAGGRRAPRWPSSSSGRCRRKGAARGRSRQAGRQAGRRPIVGVATARAAQSTAQPRPLCAAPRARRREARCGVIMMTTRSAPASGDGAILPPRGWRQSGHHKLEKHTMLSFSWHPECFQ